MNDEERTSMGDEGRTPMGDDEQARMRRPHIFAVNGASEFLNLVRDLFESEDFNITTTNFVPETFDQIAALNPSVLLVDLAHGQRAGWDLLEQLRAGWDLLEQLRAGALTHGIPTLVLSTAQASLDDVQAHQSRYGGDAFLSKPFDLDDLLNAVNALIVRNRVLTP